MDRQQLAGPQPGALDRLELPPGERGDRQPILASASGTVHRSYHSTTTGYGNTIVVDHGNGWRTRYAHLRSRAVAAGQHVSAGQRIGVIGHTSAKYHLAVHLHYEQIHNGYVVVSVVQGVRWYDYRKAAQRSTNGCGGGHATGTVHTNGTPLNVRSGPHTGNRTVGTVAAGARVTIYCQATGSRVTGRYGTTRLWDRIGRGRYVTDAYVYTGSDGRVAHAC